MAAPAEATIQNLTGVWSMDKTISTDPDPILQLQGISWLVRTAIAYSSLTLNIKEHTDPDAETGKPVVRIDIVQTTTGGISGTTEKRILNWSENDHQDHIFGHVVGKSRYIRGSKGADGKVRPNVDLQTKVEDEKVLKFLRGEVLVDGEETEGFVVDEAKGDDLGDGEGLWVQSFVVSQDSGWTGEQIWGFEIINGERRYTRRVAVADKDGNYQLGRLVYSYEGQEERPAE